MDYRRLHAWDLTPSEAVALQKRLREQVRTEPIPDGVELVAGADISFNRFSSVAYAAFVVVRLPQLTVEARSGVVAEMKFPYIPGLLSFRETPPLLEAWEGLVVRPDVVMLDGQGIAHPRRFGIACHLGLLVDLPTLGCAKSVLVGKYEEPGELAGSTSPLVDKGEQVGVALRTRDRVSPVFVSPGYRADVPSATALALRCAKGYRVPEPTRLAHLFVNAMRRGEMWSPPTTPQRSARVSARPSTRSLRRKTSSK